MLEALSWDSNHFGFPVARLESSELSDELLAGALGEARRAGIRLVYWATLSDRALPDSLLTEYGGILADRRTTFVAEPAGLDVVGSADGAGPVVEELAPGPASPALIELGIAAGACSRFRHDPRITLDRAEALYAIWTDRSARRELADVVYVARPCEGGEPIQGLITGGQAGGEGTIGLIAVGAPYRGRGIAAALLQAVHRWMSSQGIRKVSVVTQLANTRACRLYRRAGYRIASVQQFYHFWPASADHP